MANKKYHYYVLVFTSDGPKYVTGILPHHVAEYDKTKKPLELPQEVAEDIYEGLCLNFINANLVRSRFEISCQPYRYEKYQLEWKEVSNNDENSD